MKLAASTKCKAASTSCCWCITLAHLFFLSCTLYKQWKQEHINIGAYFSPFFSRGVPHLQMVDHLYFPILYSIKLSEIWKNIGFSQLSLDISMLLKCFSEIVQSTKGLLLYLSNNALYEINKCDFSSIFKKVWNLNIFCFFQG